MTSRRVLVLSRGEESIVARLREEAAELGRLRKLTDAAERRRDGLIVKLRRAGLPGRFIEEHAGVSNVRVFQIEKREAGKRGSTP